MVMDKENSFCPFLSLRNADSMGTPGKAEGYLEKSPLDKRQGISLKSAGDLSKECRGQFE
jgi:hypothetical protein